MVGQHLKNKRINTKDALEFIEAAENTYKAKQAELKPSSSNILLSYSGRMNRGKDCEKNGFLLYLKKENSADISTYCHGSMQGILNYLIRRGLDSLIEEQELQLIME